ncbi:MAG: fluoride efflux transporter CrcB [Geminicoccaceae bacterium]
MLPSSVAVAIGGGVGSLARFWLAELFAGLGVVAFPWATLVANVSGSLLIGLLAALTGPDGRLLVAPEWRLFWMVGVCGGYTTFSSFSLQTLALAQSGEWGRAGMNVALSLVLCLAAVAIGYMLGTWLNRLQGA